MLTESQVAAMRDTAEQALPDTATHYRRALVSDGGGGRIEQWAVLAEDVPCRLAPVGGGETGTTGDRIVDESTHIVTVSAKRDVAEPDRFVVDGVAYEVTLVRERGAWEVTRRIEARESPDGIPEVGS